MDSFLLNTEHCIRSPFYSNILAYMVSKESPLSGYCTSASVLIPFYSFNYRLNLKKISLVLAKRYMFLGNSTNQLFNFNTKKFLREGEIDRFHKNLCINSEETVPINKSFRL